MGPGNSNPQPAASPPPDGVDASRSLAGHVGSGMAWLMVNFGISKSLVLVAQLLLGWILSPSDFGVYAISVAITSLVTVFKDGGIRELLVQRWQEYDKLVGPVFWLGVCVNVVAGLVLAAIAPLAALAYDEPSLLWMVLITAVWIPLSSTYSIQYVRLRLDLRFKTIAWLGLTSGIIRYGGQVALALSGFGAVSFVLPLLATAIYEAIIGYAVTREWPWRHRVDMSRWPDLLREVRWIVWGNLMAGGLGQSYYLVVGLFVSKDIIGVYFFAMQLLFHVESVIGNTLQQVLVPVLSRFKHDAERTGGAAVRTIRATMLVTVPAVLGLAVVFPGIEESITIWQGKWEPAIWPLIVLSIGYPLRMILVGVASTILQAQGRWAAWAWLWTHNAVGLTIVAGVAGGVFRSPLAISVAVSAFLFATGFISTLTTVTHLGVPARTVIGSIIDVFLLGIVAAAASLYVEFEFGQALPPLLRSAVCGSMFGVLYLVAVRLVVPTHMSEGLSALPGFIARPIARLLLLPPPSGGQS